MIKLPEGELRDYLPVTMKNDVDMICLSYAIRKETEQLVKYRKASMIYHFIDSVPESILDLLAVELRSLYYSDTLPIETKRNIVKNTLRWHMQAGTPGAVAEMVKIMFGEGEVVEWPEFEEPPYTPGTFDIVTNARLTPDLIEYILSIIDRVKNARSHLRRVVIRRTVEIMPKICSHVDSVPKLSITNNKEERKSCAIFKQIASVAAVTIPTIAIVNSPGNYNDITILASENHGAVAASYPNIAAISGRLAGSRRIKIRVSMGDGAQSIPHLIITNHPNVAKVKRCICLSSKTAAASHSELALKLGGKNGRI